MHLRSRLPVILIDAIILKVWDGQASNRPVYVAMGITMDRERDILWVSSSGLAPAALRARNSG